jgi:dihydroorotate dehydrogenase electron transfer subunit
VAVREPRPAGLLLPLLPAAGHDRVTGTLSLLVEEGSPADGLWGLREGDHARLEGPIGRGFAIDPRSRHLLIVCNAEGIAPLRALLTDAVAGGRQVTVLLGARSAADVMPSWLLPDEAEYVVATADGSLGHAGSVVDLVLRYEAWADQCFAAGDRALLEGLAALSRGRDARLGVARLGRRVGRRPGRRAASPSPRRPAWLQVALPLPVGCALGVCLGCVVEGAGGPLRTCREGPTFAVDELAWDGHA